MFGRLKKTLMQKKPVISEQKSKSPGVPVKESKEENTGIKKPIAPELPPSKMPIMPRTRVPIGPIGPKIDYPQKPMPENISVIPDKEFLVGPRGPINDLGGMKKGGAVKKMAKGGSVSSASKRADGCAQRGKTKGRYI